LEDRKALDIDFTFIALIVGIAAVVSVAGAFVLVRQRRNSHKKTKDLVQHFIEQKAKSRAKTKAELARLEKSYNRGEIDKETYDRLRNVLVTVKGKKEDETDVYKYVLKKTKKDA
jgi:signal transduction histidine kinase